MDISDISMGTCMDMCADISMDISMDICRHICIGTSIDISRIHLWTCAWIYPVTYP